MTKSKFFVQITGTVNEMHPMQFKTRKQAEKAKSKYDEKVSGVGEKVEAWEEKPNGDCIDLITGEKIA